MWTNAGCTASSVVNLIPLSESFRGANNCRSLGARSELFCKCISTSQPISANLCSVRSLLRGRIILMKDNSHLAGSLQNIRCYWQIFSQNQHSGSTQLQSQTVCICLWECSSQLCWRCQLSLLFAVHWYEYRHRLSTSFKFMWTYQLVLVEHCSKSVLNFSTENTVYPEKFNYCLLYL